jgi:hypothetical protein
MKFYEVKPGSAGMSAKVSFELQNNSSLQSLISFAFFSDQAAPPIQVAFSHLVVPGVNYIGVDEPVVIPENAKYVGFVVSGGAPTSYLYKLEINELPFVERDVENITYFLQNGYLAFVTLQPNFYTYDLPSYNVMINGAQAMVFGIQKNKKQNVSFPIDGSPNLLHLVKTYIGNGMIDKMSVNLQSRMTKTTLKYDTE